MRKILFQLIVLLLLFCTESALKAQQLVWRTISSKSNITSSAVTPDGVWFGTDGGLIAVDQGSSAISYMTKTEGLASQRITSVASGRDGSVWIGFQSGYIQHFSSLSGSWETIGDYQDHPITYIDTAGDSLFVGLDIGVSLYIISKKEVKETYRHLGTSVDRDIAANFITHNSNYIWVATNQGISCAEIGAANLLDPSVWQNISETTGPEGAEVNSMVISENGELFTSSGSGVYSWKDDKWEKLFSGEVLDLLVFNSNLYLTTKDGMFKMESSQWTEIDESPSDLKFLSSGSDKIWGVAGLTIWSYSPELGIWDSYDIDCIRSNLVTSAFLDNMGREWVCSRGGGFFSKRNSGWIVFNRTMQPEMLSNEIMCIAEDLNNRIWVGTWGGGAYSVDTTDVITRYHPKDGYLAGVSENHNYSVIRDMTKDSFNNLWMLNYRAVNGLPLVCVRNNDWIYFGAGDGITSTKLISIAVDMSGRKWIGSEDKGIFVLDDFGTPDQRSDDIVTNISNADGLGSNTITGIAGDRDGVMWVGTPNGIYTIYENSINRRYGLVSDNVKDVVVDGANNVWVGTDEGLNFFSQSEYKWYLFTKEDSYLVSNDISSLFFHKESGKLYVSTSEGVSVISTPFSEPLGKLTSVKICPNPFLPEKHEKVLIDGLSLNSIVAIYTTSGYLIKYFSQNQVQGRQILWDGNDDRGNPAAGGIYIVVAEDTNGERATGKIALVR